MRNKLVILFAVIFVMSILQNCKKEKPLIEPPDPSIYNFKCIDEYTNEPVPNCIVYLSHHFWMGGVSKVIIDTTDLNGEFSYNNTFTYTYDAGNYYDYYLLEFRKPGYYANNSYPLDITDSTSNYVVKFNKDEDFCFKIRNVSQLNCSGEYYLCFNVAINSDELLFIPADSVSPTIYYNYYLKVRSNKDYIVKWRTKCNNVFTPGHTQTLTTGYNDTTYFYIDF